MEQLLPLATHLSEILRLDKKENSPLQNCGSYIFYVLQKGWDTLKNRLESPTSTFNDIKEIPEADIILDYAWEKIHSVVYTRVDAIWRLLYAAAGCIKAIDLLSRSQLFSNIPQLDCNGKKAIHSLDLVIILAGRQHLLANEVNALLSWVEVTLASNTTATELDTCTMFSGVESLENLAIPLLHPLPISFTPESQPSIIWFTEYLQRNDLEPFVLRKTFQQWPAVQRWKDKNYILKAGLGGERWIPVEIGSNYIDPLWTQKLLSLGDFIERYVENPSASGEDRGYLAQYDLFSHLPTLRKDIYIPDYCFVHHSTNEELSDVAINAWIGPKGTVSPLHHDPKHNIFVQVVGFKYIKLCGPQYKDHVYPFQESEGAYMNNTSQADVRHPDMDQFPLLEKVEFFDIILGPGDGLFIPAGWWHYVESLSISFSVSFWF